MKKLDNPFTSQPEDNPKFWTAKSKPLKDFRNFFEVEAAQRGSLASNAVVGDVGSGKTRLFEYLAERFKLDPTKVVCSVSLNRIFTDLTPEYIREIGVSFLKIFHNEIYKQLEKIYDSVSKSEETNDKQKELAENILGMARETKRKVIGQRLKQLAGLERTLQKIEEGLKKSTSKEEKEQLQGEKEAQEFAISKTLREELFNPDEFYSFLDIFLKRLKDELKVEVFILYVDELERVREMEQYHGIFLKSTVESELRDQLIKKFELKGLKIVVACTRKAWEGFEARFTSSFPPKMIPNLEAEDLEAAIEDHLEKIGQQEFNPFKDKNAIKFVAYYSYSNFRQCMIALNGCYWEYINQYEKGNPQWICSLDYVVKERFSDSIRIGFYNDCIRILEGQLPRISERYIDFCMKTLLLQFEEFDYNTLQKKLANILSNKSDFDTFINSLRNIGAIDEIKPNVYVVKRENFAILEVRRSELEDKVLRAFHELAAGKSEVERISLLKRLSEQGMDDVTIGNVLKALKDTLQPIGDKIVFIGVSPSDLEIMRGYIREAGREPWKSRVEKEIKKLAPYVLSQIWEFQISKFDGQENIWQITRFFDPGTGGGIEEEVHGLVLFRDYRYEKPSAEETLKEDIRELRNILKKDGKLRFALILCVCEPPLPNALARKGVSREEMNEIRGDPGRWRGAKVGGVFGIDEGVLGDENTVSKQGYDIIWKEARIYFSDQIFVYPIYGEAQFVPDMKFENEKIIDYILATDKIANYYGKKLSEIEARYLDHAKRDIQNLLVNPIQDRLVTATLSKMWEINVHMGKIEEAVWPQSAKKGKWSDSDVVLEILGQIGKTGVVKADERTQRLLSGLITCGFFGYRGKVNSIEEVYLRRETSLSGKSIPVQFKEIYEALSAEPRDAVDIFATYLHQREPFKAEAPEEETLRTYLDRFKTSDIRGLIGSVDLALYVLSKMFADVLQEKNEKSRFTYKLLKEVPADPKKFLQTSEELNEVIKFLEEKGFELDKESQEIKELLSIGQAVRKKLEKALDIDAKQILAMEAESKLTKEKASAIQRLDQLNSNIWDRLIAIREAFLAYPIIIEWQKNPYFEKWNLARQSTEKIGLPPTPREIKEFLERNISAWVKEEEYSKEKVKKIIEIWETRIWSALYDKMAEDAEPITKLTAAVNDGMKSIPHISPISEKIGKVPMKFNDYIEILKPIKDLKQIESTLRIDHGYIKSYNEKMNAYNSKVVSLCYELMKMSRAELGKLTFIVSELTKIDACNKKAEEYQTTVRKGRPQFGEKFDYIMAKFARSEIDEEEIKAKLYDLLKDLLLNWLYGSLVLYVFESDAKEEMIKTLSDSLKLTKFAKFRENLEKVKDFCEAYKVKFEKETWKKCEDRCTEKYDTFVKGYIDGIWQNQPTIPIEGQDIHNITQFEQLIYTLNDKIIRDIINSIPDKMDEPYSFILREIKDAYDRWKMEGKKEMFATILKLLNSPKITRQKLTPEQVLQFLEKVEKFSLLW